MRTTTATIYLYWIIFFVEKESTPRDDELELLGDDIAEDWMMLGRCLGVSDSILSEINSAHNQWSGMGYHMLKHWKRKNGSAATYRTLCEALQHPFVQRKDLAVKFFNLNGN